jgi:predicted RNase H-like nuclease (RuvC/YqgF family)
MDLHFYLWLMMSACAVALLIVNRRKQKMIDEYKSLLQKYGKGCNETDDVGKLKESIESADKLIKEQQETIEDLQRRSRKYIDMMEELKKQAAGFTPMKSMADYTEKIQKFSEQAEDMFGLYIDTIHLERGNSMFIRYWKVDMKTSGRKKPKEETDLNP